MATLHNSTSDLHTVWKNTTVVVVGLMASMLVFNVVAIVLRQQGIQFATPVDLAATTNGLSNQLLYFILYGMIFTFIIVTRFYYRISFVANPPQDRAAALRKLQSVHITLGALAEAVCVIGFMLFLLLHLYRDLLVLSVLSLVLQLVHFPRKAQWMRYLERTKESPFSYSSPIIQ